MVLRSLSEQLLAWAPPRANAAAPDVSDERPLETEPAVPGFRPASAAMPAMDAANIGED
jgi:hypothetical protein